MAVKRDGPILTVDKSTPQGHWSFNSLMLIQVKRTLVLRHYVKHCRLTDKASIQHTEAAGELAGE